VWGEGSAAEKLLATTGSVLGLLRQRRALRDVGLDPDEAEVRPPQVVENYEQ
jgi:uncharacterized protein DUF2630